MTTDASELGREAAGPNYDGKPTFEIVVPLTAPGTPLLDEWSLGPSPTRFDKSAFDGYTSIVFRAVIIPLSVDEQTGFVRLTSGYALGDTVDDVAVIAGSEVSETGVGTADNGYTEDVYDSPDISAALPDGPALYRASASYSPQATDPDDTPYARSAAIVVKYG